MTFHLLVLHSDLSAGMNFIRSLNHAKAHGWGHDVNIIGVASHPLRMQMSAPAQTFLLEPSLDLAHSIALVQAGIGGRLGLIYEPKSAEYMLRLSELRESVPTFLPPHLLLQVFEDKHLTYQHLNDRGFPVPETYLVNTPADIEDAFRRIKTDTVWVRDTHGQGGRGAYSSNSAAFVREEVGKRNSWGKCTISAKLPTQTEHSWQDRLSSRCLPGEMVTWTALYSQGTMIASQVRKRLYWEHGDLVPSGVTGYSGATMTISRSDIHDLSDRIVRSFDWEPQGPLGIDYVIDEDGVARVTEIQASRFFASMYPMALLGVNFPRLFVDAYRGHLDGTTVIDPCDEGYLYIQRFGSPGILVHRDEVLGQVADGVFLNPRASDDF